MPSTAKRRLADSITVPPEVVCYYDPLLPRMLAFYEGGAKNLSDQELHIAIDKEFGQDLVRAVCEPLGFYQGACAFISVVLLRQRDKRLLTH